MLQISWLLLSLDISPQIRLGNPNGVIPQLRYKIFQESPHFGFYRI